MGPAATRISPARASLIVLRLRRVQDTLRGRMTGAVDRFFRGQAEVAVSVFLDRQSRQLPDGGIVYKQLDPWALIPPEDAARLQAIVRPYLLQMILAASQEMGELVGLSGLTDSDPATLSILRSAGQRIVAINDVTRDAVQRTLQEGLARGLSDYEIARGVSERRDEAGTVIREAFRGLRDTVEETYTHRADAIARTETAMASGEATVDRYREAGVSQVDIIDGPECGWTFHDDPDVADGSQRTVGEYQAQILSHPNCRRVGMPVLP